MNQRGDKVTTTIPVEFLETRFTVDGKPQRGIAVIGSRKYIARDVMFRVLDKHEWLAPLNNPNGAVVISGGCEGPDQWVEKWMNTCPFAREQYSFMIIRAPFVNTAKGYFSRNQLVAQMANCIIAFIPQNQFRSGTWNTIRHFRDLGKRTYVVFDQNGEQWDRKWAENTNKPKDPFEEYGGLAPATNGGWAWR